MDILGGLDSPTARQPGTYRIDGVDIRTTDEDDLGTDPASRAAALRPIEGLPL